ncbi:hypothetical protein CARUB_v10019237mg [Capsella rubella]|uniref:Uncharacterized protein n=1 Tax=Capsella rubella TaxID=81985 RepID=R0HPH8_9BRAS|nr:hypothetical protein CARUB_v10019237mg [Capsella rubella]
MYSQYLWPFLSNSITVPFPLFFFVNIDINCILITCWLYNHRECILLQQLYVFDSFFHLFLFLVSPCVAELFEVSMDLSPLYIRAALPQKLCLPNLYFDLLGWVNFLLFLSFFFVNSFTKPLSPSILKCLSVSTVLGSFFHLFFFFVFFLFPLIEISSNTWHASLVISRSV